MGRTLTVRQDIGHLQPIPLAPEVEAVHIDLHAGGQPLLRIEVPVQGDLSGREVTELALEAMGLRPFLRTSRLLRRPRFWLHAAMAWAGLVAQTVTKRHRPSALAKSALAEAVLALAGPRPASGSGERALAALIAEARAAAGNRGEAEPSRGEAVARGTTAQGMTDQGTTDRVPVLMYHRIAADGPPGLARYRVAPEIFARQMQWLRQHGFHAVTSLDVARHLESGRPFPGRPVMISFDDGYRDFHDAAWPALQANGLRAEVFLVTGMIGGVADWDADHGAPAPLMDWTEIKVLDSAGVRFGSHMASHSRIASLSIRQVALEAAGSRATLERALGRECLSVAAPFGEGDERFVRIARACGYKAAFTIEPGVARLGGDPLRLPRLEVPGDWSLDDFIGCLQKV
jgi:peptidoglycan/xylan/chitin deacetylase (PgdA/CDA1 family)